MDKFLRKIRKIYRIIFPAKYTSKDIFENRLNINEEVISYEAKDDYYLVNFRNDVKIKVRSHEHSDILVFDQVFSLKEYGIVLKIVQLNSHAEEKIIIDVGANVGYTSIFFGRTFHNSRIFAVEPDRENSKVFLYNLRQLSSEVNLYQNALSPESGNFYSTNRNFRDGQDWSIVTEPDVNEKVEGISLEDIIEKNNLEYISLLKIDIEGAERFIFNKETNLEFLKK